MGKLQDKAAIVTGATSGMGRATARLFAREGASLLASGRDAERGAALVDEIRRDGGRAEFVAGDVSLPETNERLVETCRRSFGGVDAAVCCAGMLGLGSATDVPVETWRQTLAVNLDAVFYLLRFALPDMERRGGIVRRRRVDRRPQGVPEPRRLLRVQGCARRPRPAGRDRLRARRSASTHFARARSTRRSSGSPRWHSRIRRRRSKTWGRRPS